MTFRPQVSLLLLCPKNKNPVILFFFLTRGLSSDIVLRLCAHSTSRNTVPVAAPQQERMVYARFLSQSLHPYDRRFADCSIIFYSGKHRSAFTVPDYPNLTHPRALTEL